MTSDQPQSTPSSTAGRPSQEGGTPRAPGRSEPIDTADRPSGEPVDTAGRGSGEPVEGTTARAAVPGLARLAVGAYWNTAGWAAGASLRVGSRVFRAAVNGEAPGALVAEATGELREGARRLLGVSEPQEPEPAQQRSAEQVAAREQRELRTQGEDLLRRSADLRAEEGFHPAYERILAELAPDEARVLRLLATRGPQPAVDVRTWRPLGIGDSLVAAGLSMIASEAGLLRPERIHPYLDNLARLGLVWFSHEPLPDPRDYQVLEAQPEVGEAMREAGRGRTVRRSIQLTSFGVDFCRAALPLEPIADRDTSLARSAASAEAEPPPEPDPVEPAAFEPSPKPAAPTRAES